MVPHILVIDDQISLPHFIAMELRAEGYRVSMSHGNTIELSIIQALDPDLVILNWELRCYPGLDAYRQLRIVDNQVPIVVITTDDESSYRLALELSVQSCLTKPFSMHDLLEAIKSHLCDQPCLQCYF